MEGTGGGVKTRVTGRKDSDQDDSVHNVTSDADTGLDKDTGEGRGLDAAASVGKGIIVVGDGQSDDQDGKDVEHQDTPEDLTDSTGDVLAGVLGLSGSDSDQLSSLE